ncbi:MAG: hypothetical protein HQK87_10630 [Nitrospinae bacterium]|nr:hypothetical protein [Nitrospinota bacterium]
MIFDRTKLKLKPLSSRIHDINIDIIKQLEPVDIVDDKIREVAIKLSHVKSSGKGAVIMMIGGHVIRAGVQNYMINLMEKGYITCIATNGACAIHDFEFALIGATTESVARYVKEGQFGLWKETGQINDIINEGYTFKLGMGESIGKAIYESDFRYKHISIFAQAYRLKIPITVHVGIGYDIIHEHPNCRAEAVGATSYKDFLKLAGVINNLEDGIVMNFGSAVMAPEVFLKALSMARNIAHQHNKEIKRFTTAVFDLVDIPDNFNTEPSKDSHAYYFRPWKTMLIRTVADGGQSFYIKGYHSQTIPQLWSALRHNEQGFLT